MLRGKTIIIDRFSDFYKLVRYLKWFVLCIIRLRMFVKFVNSICYLSVFWQGAYFMSVVSSIYIYVSGATLKEPAFVSLLNMLCKYATPFIFATGVLLSEFKPKVFKLAEHECALQSDFFLVKF